MTSAEFAAKYRVLKTITERGARSQIAQETALGRMVMVHHLDVGTSAERQRLVARLGSLDPAATAKVFDLVTVDGTQVLVTHYLATFTDLPSWIDQNTVSTEAATVVMDAIAPPPAAPTKQAGASFTKMFGAPKPAEQQAPAAPAREPSDFTRLSQGVTPPKPPTVPPPPAPSSPPVAPPPAPAQFAAPAAHKPVEQGESFTRVFGNLAPPPTAPAPVPPAFASAPPSPPISPAAPRFDSVMPPAAPYVPPPPPAPAPAPTSSDFTQLFSRLDPHATTPATPSYPPTPPAYVPPPSPPPMWSPLATPAASVPPAPSWQAHAPPPPIAPPPLPSRPAMPPAAPVMPVNPGAQAGGPSEFTRVLGRVAPQGPSMPPAPTLPPVPPRQVVSTPVIAPPVEPARSEKKSSLPLIIALNVIVIVAILLVVLLVIKK
jgi:hypothetical protein